MPVRPQVSYPGVYVQEVPSGVRTIVGVSTSIAVFIGRAKQGQMNKPVLCLNYSDFERVFSSEYAGSDMARAVRLFFQNGGTQCYVMRIADGAIQSEVTLESEDGTPVLRVTAKSPGLVGDNIRLAVTYNGLHPESTFNLEVFRWERNLGGVFVKKNREYWSALSMDPASPRYAVEYVNQNSDLVELEDLDVAATASCSLSGRPVPINTDEIFRDQWMSLIGTNVPTDPVTDSTPNCFRISVDGGFSFFDVDLSGIDFDSNPDLDTPAEARANFAGIIEGETNGFLPSGASVTVPSPLPAGPAGPSGEDHENTVMLRIESASGDVRIEPAARDDLAGPLMLGTAQGGIEVSRYAQNRPAPTGVVFNLGADLANLVTFAEQEQTAFRTFTVDTTDIDLTDTATLVTSGDTDRMYQDGYDPSITGNSDGVREKWTIIADAINAEKASNPTFRWSAEVWGSRLALLPGDGGENSQGTVATSGGDDVNISNRFLQNVRYYSLGPSGQGGFQIPAGAPASDGNAPTLTNYRNAFEVLDKEVDLFNLMILPTDEDHSASTTASLWGPASVFCQKRRAFLLMDPPASWGTVQDATHPSTGVNSLRVGLVKDHSAIFYPRITITENGLKKNIGGSGAIAGLMARIDGSRGVWKAPAGTEADLRGIAGLEYRFSDDENGVLNPRSINTLRVFPNGIVSWGARTMDGDDDFGSEYKYIPVRRLALYMEESLYRGLKWVVFEPNDEP
ncbi:MAG: phage tail sheath subtilisin-like domain-containing protein, partial [Deltaproteobacteria bacterium]|nr:phage tail sheath subtilisin-like domain-containing protein [Deltaproteobacteria bacterium]